MIWVALLTSPQLCLKQSFNIISIGKPSTWDGGSLGRWIENNPFDNSAKFEKKTMHVLENFEWQVFLRNVLYEC